MPGPEQRMRGSLSVVRPAVLGAEGAYRSDHFRHRGRQNPAAIGCLRGNAMQARDRAIDGLPRVIVEKHVETEADGEEGFVSVTRLRFDQNTAELVSVDQKVIGPF